MGSKKNNEQLGAGTRYRVGNRLHFTRHVVVAAHGCTDQYSLWSISILSVLHP